MTYKRYLFVIAATALVAWVGFILVIMKLEPCTAPGELTICHSVSALSLTLFFLSAFFALTTTFTLLGYLLRIWFHRYEIYLDHLTVSLRQAILLAFCSLGALALLLLNSLTWWSGMLLVAIIILIELYFTRGT